MAAGTARAETPEDWQTFESPGGGYVVQVPGDWTIEERTDDAGLVATAFTMPDRSGRVDVVVRPTQPPGDADVRVGNQYCQPAQVAGRPATRCLTTVSFSLSTTLVTGTRTYVLSTSLRHLDEATYQAIVDSFQLPGAPTADALPSNGVQGDRFADGGWSPPSVHVLPPADANPKIPRPAGAGQP